MVSSVQRDGQKQLSRQLRQGYKICSNQPGYVQLNQQKNSQENYYNFNNPLVVFMYNQPFLEKTQCLLTTLLR